MPERCRVLVIDDDDGIRDALSVVIEDEGCRVVCVGNGQEALARLRSGAALPCLILLDLMMPVMDGREFRARQLEDERLARIPTVVMTAGSIPPEVAGLQVLRKPLQMAQLTRLLRSCGKRPHHPEADGTRAR